MNNYIVISYINCLGSKCQIYLRRIISYKNKKWVDTIDINKAFKYKSEVNAIKAAQLCSGEIRVI